MVDSIEEKIQPCVYIDTNISDAQVQFAEVFRALLQDMGAADRGIVILCIGSDRSTGDALGPLVGRRLSAYDAKALGGAWVYGTLDAPVHAKNLTEMVRRIARKHPSALVIAVDASLGRMESIGSLTLGKGGIQPGSAFHKNLPPVGDIFVTGIVSYSNGRDTFGFQDTRLSLVMRMADFICEGIVNSIESNSIKICER